MEEFMNIFDYGSISEEQKKVVEEIARILKDKGEKDTATELLVKFKVEAPKEYDLNNSIFYKACQQANIHVVKQGYNIENGIYYPMITVGGDSRELDKIILSLGKTE